MDNHTPDHSDRSPADGFEHRPVMVEEIVALFEPVPTGLVVDATIGGGGHAHAVLDSRPDLVLLGLDQDADAIAAATERLAPFGDRVTIRRARFDELTQVVESIGHLDVVAVLFDLGVSSWQLDDAARGFSYRRPAPLDMRMDQRSERSADDVVNRYSERDLSRVLRTYGDERFARPIARAIVAARPVHTTVDLAEVVRSAIPAPARRRGGHPATRSFQAIRIEVNQELAVLPSAIDQAVALLVPGGRCAVLTYHSGEDRIVKERFLVAESGGCTCPDHLPCVCGAVPKVRLLRRGGWTPTADERATNRRAESARLRAVEKLEAAA
ncbi:MAG: 16S rRNA (cytosine(1402)-N(4))-methyltransferase RsmH [Acidimicrobiales bacterium]|nr:16S rRNA (cytosine(1402)-N(4))-methyltransferase RsmH [Acidimicrobiales bacterium]